MHAAPGFLLNSFAAAPTNITVELYSHGRGQFSIHSLACLDRETGVRRVVANDLPKQEKETLP